jgi:TolB-like protein/DNA-binding winged helix-turn-helix (wHTH) protein
VSQLREYHFGDFVVDLDAWQLSLSGRVVHLEPTVFKLLVFLIENRDRLVLKSELLDTVWGDTHVSESALTKAVARLRKALGDDPHRPEYIETVHALGYRFVAEVQDIEQPVEKDSFRAKSRRSTFAAMVFAGVAVIVILLFSQQLSDLWMQQPATEQLRVRSLAVLPLDNLSGDPEQNYFVDGLHEALITDLSKISSLKVISRQSSMRYRTSNKLVPEIAQELNVDAVIEGSVLLVGERVRVTAQLIHGQTDEHMWAETYDRDLQDVFALLGEVARAITDEIEIVLMPQEEERLARTVPVDPEANDAYLRGMYFLNKFTIKGFQESLKYFHQAVETDPDFAPGWAGLSGAHLLIAYFGDEPPREAILQARVAALKALQLDDQLSAAYSALGWVRLYTQDWPGAGEAFEEALRLNPNDSATYHGYADYLTLTGRAEEGLVQVKRGRAIDPLTPMATLPVPFHLYMMRQYDESIAEASKLLKTDPDYPVNRLLSKVYWQKGMFEEALAEYRKTLVRRKDSGLLEALDNGNADSGPHGAMRAVALELVARSKLRYVDSFRIASVFAQAGEVDLAFEWLNNAVDQGSLELVYFNIRPEFDPLRDDPRYKSLMHRLGLPNP